MATDDSAPPRIMSAEETVPARSVHVDARALFSALPCLRRAPIFGTSVEAFGPKCVLSMGLSEFLCKGLADYLIRFSLFPMFRRRYGVDAMTYQRMANLAFMGWSMKPITAMFSDIFSFFGYTKRWYLAVSCVVGAAFALAFALLPPAKASAAPAAAFVFLTSFTKANVDILTQGHYSRLIRRIPLAGSSLVSWVWWWVLLGSLVASVIAGPLADASLEWIGVIVAATLQFVTTFFFVMNWYGENKNRVNRAEDAKFMRAKLLEERRDSSKRLREDDDTAVAEMGNHSMLVLSDEVCAGVSGEEEDEVPPLPTCCCGVFEVNKEVARRSWRIVLYCLLVAAGSVVMAIVTVLGDIWSLLYACIAVSVAVCVFGFFALPLVIAKANLYLFLSMASYIQLPGALDSFYMARPDCLPDGPHFSFFFYNTVASIIGNIGGIVGILLFRYVFSKKSYRITFVVTTLVMVVASIFDLIIVERWNRPRVSDHVVYVLGDQVVYRVCYMLHFMPNIILLSRLCPRGTESMVYALLAGFSNFGQAVSNTVGSLLMEFKWPVETDPAVGCDFSNVRWLLIVGRLLCPLVCIPLVFLLIPAARICDNIDVDGRVVRPQEPPGDCKVEGSRESLSAQEPVLK
ncbi:folate/pteridine transporter, putative [Trypanosoma cruzi]|uniref:Folate/pteridine transporter, putative n=1 Tax=Trypanosoma cruzi (strain CL Brener) TaxID=353153 RepID=Q4DG60_TRYCC|nr:folate/pteridine transporter, putative [Trypanosoma cruzi]EAN91522.1 folate/pteridine transporter, putative [Trypanosoma cruzi]|eukprot:XP_813373.1 folate/pteridine transporter [Trypanosoma cruzi strain CL Brener]